MSQLSFETLLQESVKMHGHLCPGQVLGVRMSMLGLREIGISNPKGSDRKNLIIFVEMDRCATDAVQSVTGCSLGKRSMKYFDYGKMAATYMNLKTNKAVRIVARKDSSEKAKGLFPDIENKYMAQIEAYKVMLDGELFDVMDVTVQVRPEDMPGRPMRRVQCDSCGEHVQDMREVCRDGRVLCVACSEGGYYEVKNTFLPCVMQETHNGLDIRSKIWIEVGGEPVFGRGRRFLLEAIDSYGSINRAAQEVDISFRKAWGHIKAMESRLGMKLVERQAGGKNGGGATLTDDARKFLKKYEVLEKGIQEMVDKRFRSIFKGGPHV
ncbi:MAG TPA: FmdE family protein [Nitrospirota bacterium]|nr:FmdE family protein [Nitrospirota bacterium]